MLLIIRVATGRFFHGYQVRGRIFCAIRLPYKVSLLDHTCGKITNFVLVLPQPATITLLTQFNNYYSRTHQIYYLKYLSGFKSQFPTLQHMLHQGLLTMSNAKILLNVLCSVHERQCFRQCFEKTDRDCEKNFTKIWKTVMLTTSGQSHHPIQQQETLKIKIGEVAMQIDN